MRVGHVLPTFCVAYATLTYRNTLPSLLQIQTTADGSGTYKKPSVVEPALRGLKKVGKVTLGGRSDKEKMRALPRLLHR